MRSLAAIGFGTLTLVVAWAIWTSRAQPEGSHALRPAFDGTVVPPPVARTASTSQAPPLAGAPAPSAARNDPASAQPSEIDRERALQAAARAGTPDDIAWLAKLAGASDPSATRAAAALGSVANHEAAAALEQLGRSDAPTLVRSNAIHALARSGGPGDVDSLCRMVTDDTQPLRVRQEAALALAPTGGAAAGPCLIGALRAAPQGNDVNAEQLRISLVQALGASGSSEGLAFLKAYAAGDLPRDERAFVAKYVAAD